MIFCDFVHLFFNQIGCKKPHRNLWSRPSDYLALPTYVMPWLVDTTSRGKTSLFSLSLNSASKNMADIFPVETMMMPWWRTTWRHFVPRLLFFVEFALWLPEFGKYVPNRTCERNHQLGGPSLLLRPSLGWYSTDRIVLVLLWLADWRHHRFGTRYKTFPWLVAKVNSFRDVCYFIVRTLLDRVRYGSAIVYPLRYVGKVWERNTIMLKVVGEASAEWMLWFLRMGFTRT